MKRTPGLAVSIAGALCLAASTAPADDRNADSIPDERTPPEFWFEVLPAAAEPGDGRTQFAVGEGTQELRVWLHTQGGPPGAEGAQGWSFALATRGCALSWATTAGTAGAAVDDDPPGLRDRGFEVTRLEDPDTFLDPVEAPADGAVLSAVVLSLQVPVTLDPAESPHLLLRIGVEALSSDAAGDCAECEITFPDWLYIAGIEDDHVVTWRAQTVRPSARKSASIRFCTARFHRGDTDGDGSLDVSDALGVFSYLFLTGDDPDCLEAANANDDAFVNIADGIFLLSYLFLGSPPPPAPGPPGEPCGDDPGGARGDLGCLGYEICA